MTLCILLITLIALLLALTGYACCVVSSEAERQSEAYLKRKREENTPEENSREEVKREENKHWEEPVERKL